MGSSKLRPIMYTSCSTEPTLAMPLALALDLAPTLTLSLRLSLTLTLTLTLTHTLTRYRPSLIWSWDKLDVLPVIPVFNIAR